MRKKSDLLVKEIAMTLALFIIIPILAACGGGEKEQSITTQSPMPTSIQSSTLSSESQQISGEITFIVPPQEFKDSQEVVEVFKKFWILCEAGNLKEAAALNFYGVIDKYPPDEFEGIKVDKIVISNVEVEDSGDTGVVYYQIYLAGKKYSYAEDPDQDWIMIFEKIDNQWKVYSW